MEALCATEAGVPLARLFMLNPMFDECAISRFGTPRMRDELLPGLINGSKLLSFAHEHTEIESSRLTNRKAA